MRSCGLVPAAAAAKCCAERNSSATVSDLAPLARPSREPNPSSPPDLLSRSLERDRDWMSPQVLHPGSPNRSPSQMSYVPRNTWQQQPQYRYSAAPGYQQPYRQPYLEYQQPYQQEQCVQYVETPLEYSGPYQQPYRAYQNQYLETPLDYVPFVEQMFVAPQMPVGTPPCPYDVD
ncbi:hypothetical protein T484DRAFT_1744882 [Baffinella frigidus]|nr:hypothetical protein T484DRAFT_1744882 [Cryptophyta sp. CCMP2293]